MFIWTTYHELGVEQVKECIYYKIKDMEKGKKSNI